MAKSQKKLSREIHKSKAEKFQLGAAALAGKRGAAAGLENMKR